MYKKTDFINCVSNGVKVYHTHVYSSYSKCMYECTNVCIENINFVHVHVCHVLYHDDGTVEVTGGTVMYQVNIIYDYIFYLFFF
jgi:hypothetical protein